MATQEEIGSWLGLSSRQVRNLQKEGVLSDKRGRNGYCLKTCVSDYIRHIKKQIKTGPDVDADTPAGGTDFHDERYAKLRADKLELDVLGKLGEMAGIDLIVALTAGKAAQVAGILDQLPAKVHRVAPDIPSSVKVLIENEIIAARNTAAEPLDLAPYLSQCPRESDISGVESGDSETA
ncbi:hypothetical protein NFHSH190041_36890 (plasmid) [Shewanella sp. NFH-SH190041]|uniref:terminase small subunit n=1 Tax=Shewanella sp. NFH-SH190041 TaxID=2950245 RepID=UPI0021C3A5CE|nr:terminase small subunit [Shewanella sp. NFH-SH190041]BDM66237.1 hypothetical protein NFHSH190041_36890 [Shewanella sp. NFH-SH190041]